MRTAPLVRPRTSCVVRGAREAGKLPNAPPQHARIDYRKRGRRSATSIRMGVRHLRAPDWQIEAAIAELKAARQSPPGPPTQTTMAPNARATAKSSGSP
jgi:hypothetical protein